jgi:N-acetylmuramoyl-L-alanine amidase
MKKIMLIGIVIVAGVCIYCGARAIPTISTSITNRTVIIDAGHGGEDPGAIGNSGSLEKDINLNIALKLQQFVEQNGGLVLMTRVDDAEMEGSKKNDMRLRKKLREENEGDIFISIHLNSYPSESCKGAQTFYANDEKSKELAEKIQKNMVDILDENNTRVAKKLTDVYLLKNVNIPSVIVECGFVSNSYEEKLLMDENYQSKVAMAIFMGINEYFGVK